jgi:hypothetical protein
MFWNRVLMDRFELGYLISTYIQGHWYETPYISVEPEKHHPLCLHGYCLDDRALSIWIRRG